MTASAALADALRSFAAVEQQIIALDRLGDDGDPIDLVRLRRALAMEFGALSAALDADPFLKANPTLMAQAMRLLAAFRSQNAINQADWPAIRVREDRARYRLSSRQVANRSADFWAWVNEALQVAP